MLETWNKVRNDISALKLYCLCDWEKKNSHKNITLGMNETLVKSDKHSSSIKTIKHKINKDNTKSRISAMYS